MCQDEVSICEHFLLQSASGQMLLASIDIGNVSSNNLNTPKRERGESRITQSVSS